MGLQVLYQLHGHFKGFSRNVAQQYTFTVCSEWPATFSKSFTAARCGRKYACSHDAFKTANPKTHRYSRKKTENHSWQLAPIFKCGLSDAFRVQRSRAAFEIHCHV